MFLAAPFVALLSSRRRTGDGASRDEPVGSPPMSDKVALIARITVRPEAAAEAEAALRRLVDAAADEAGTVEYVLNREGDSGSFWFYEVYADQAAFDAHGKNPALGRGLRHARRRCSPSRRRCTC